MRALSSDVGLSKTSSDNLRASSLCFVNHAARSHAADTMVMACRWAGHHSGTLHQTGSILLQGDASICTSFGYVIAVAQAGHTGYQATLLLRGARCSPRWPRSAANSSHLHLFIPVQAGTLHSVLSNSCMAPALQHAPRAEWKPGRGPAGAVYNKIPWTARRSLSDRIISHNPLLCEVTRARLVCSCGAPRSRPVWKQLGMQPVGPAHLLNHKAAERLNLAVLRRIDSATEEVRRAARSFLSWDQDLVQSRYAKSAGLSYTD